MTAYVILELYLPSVSLSSNVSLTPRPPSMLIESVSTTYRLKKKVKETEHGQCSIRYSAHQKTVRQFCARDRLSTGDSEQYHPCPQGADSPVENRAIQIKTGGPREGWQIKDHGYKNCHCQQKEKTMLTHLAVTNTPNSVCQPYKLIYLKSATLRIRSFPESQHGSASQFSITMPNNFWCPKGQT